MLSIVLLTILAFLLSLLLTPLMRAWSLRRGLVDRPDQRRRIHTVDTPNTGGIALLVSYAAVYALLPVLRPAGGAELDLSLIWRLSPPVALIFMTGLFDDWFCLTPWQKLGGQLVAAICAYTAGVRIMNVAGHELVPWFSFLLTVGWLILCSNAFNLIDGIDGLAAGAGLTAALTLCLIGLLRGDLALVLLSAPFAGCLIGFLCYNFSPASIFLGDSGSLLIGFLLGSFGIILMGKAATMIDAAAAAMVLAIPLLDVGLSIARRFLRNEPIFSADRGHVHHRLLDLGFAPRRVAVLLYVACGLSAALSLLQNVTKNRFGGLAIFFFGLATCAGVRYLRYAEFIAVGRFVGTALRPLLGAHVKLEVLEQSLNSAATVEQCWQAIERAGRALGYSQINALFGGKRFSTEAHPTAGGPYWQMRLNLPDNCYVNITQRQGSSEQPALVIPFVEIVRRVLPGRLAKLNAAGLDSPLPAGFADHAVPVNSRTRTVMSSDCAAPSVNAATAS